MSHSLLAESHAGSPGLLQGLDPRVKLVGLLFLIGAAVSVARLGVCLGILIAAVGIALASGISLRTLCLRVWVGVLFFTGLIALPALFTTPGRPMAVVPMLNWAVSQQGMESAARLVLRAETAATLGILLVLTTPWNHVLKAMRVFRIPVALVVILGMTQRYVLLLLQTATDYFEARRCRLVGKLGSAQRRHLMAATSGELLGKSLQLSEEVYAAMQARGYRGEPCTLDEFCMKRRDWAGLVCFLALALVALWLGKA